MSSPAVVSKYLKFMQAVLSEINQNRPIPSSALSKEHGVATITIGVMAELLFIREVGKDDNGRSKNYVWVPSNAPSTADAKKVANRINEIHRTNYAAKKNGTQKTVKSPVAKVAETQRPAIIAHTAESSAPLRARTVKIKLNDQVSFEIPLTNGVAEMTIGDSKIQIAL